MTDCRLTSLLLLLLLLLTGKSQSADAAAAAAAAPCPADGADCAIRDLPAPASGADLLARLSGATRRFTLSNLSLYDWPDTQQGAAAGQLESLVLDGVSTAGVPANQQLLGRATPKLRSLLIRGGGAGSCPFGGGIAEFPELQELTVTGCRMGGVGGGGSTTTGSLNATWLRFLPQLRRLTVENARVDGVHLAGLDPATRTALVELRLAGNSFNNLADDSFGEMPNLATLTLEGNVVQFIQPEAFARLPALRELSITLPKEGQLAKIWENNLDGRFDNNSRLEVLRLVNARLAEDQIQRCFEPLKQLKVLDLSGHRFRQLQMGVLSGLTALEQLDLSNGSLVCLYERNFGVMGRLRRLNLANNAIQVIGQRALLGLPSLVSLDLSGNPIEAIEPGAFCTLRPEVKNPPAPQGLLASWGLNPSKVEGAVNVSDPCPPDLHPNRLILSIKPRCAMRSYGGGPGSNNNSNGDGRRLPEGSRNTFLIIIGLCVAFLLVTVISMMAYKGWSKRKNAQLAKDEEKELELQAMVTAAEGPGGASVDGAGASGGGGKKPHNGRQHRQKHQRHHHHQQQPAEQSEQQQQNPSSEKPPPQQQQSQAPQASSSTEVETTAQIESPERCGQVPQDASPSQPQPQPQPQQQPQMRPGITPMTTVPEDSDLEARAITTLVVI